MNIIMAYIVTQFHCHELHNSAHDRFDAQYIYIVMPHIKKEWGCECVSQLVDRFVSIQ